MAEENPKFDGLVRRAQAGDQSAIEKLTDCFYQKIFRLVYFRTFSQADAEDLTQEIFVQMIKHLKRLRDVTRFKGWLYRIAVNKVNDFHRKKKFLSFFSVDSDTDTIDQMATPSNAISPDKKMIHKEFQSQLKHLTDSLPRWEREIFCLRFLDEMEVKEISRTLNKNENTVKTHLYRALKKFRDNNELRLLLKGVDNDL